MIDVIEFADLFAGGGGTTTGVLLAAEALGVRTEAVAVNHWPTAVASHAENHREVRHFCADIQQVDPLEVVPSGRLDLLWASPECVHFSRARGGKPVNEQRRSGADWVLEWLEKLDVRCLIMENVEEWLSWGDVDAGGKPLSRTRGRLFVRWWKRLQKLGYRAEYKVLNAADFGDATTRKRLFVMARKDGMPIAWPEPTHSKTGSLDLFGELKRWRPARDIIDWSRLGTSLFGRKKPLSLKTRLRIGRGAQKFWGALAPLYIRLLDLPADQETKLVEKCADGPARSFVLSRNGHNDPNGRARSVDEPTATATSSGSGTGYLVTPAAEPFIAASTENAVPKPIADPLGTLTTIPGVYLAVPRAEPFVFANRNNAVPVATDGPAPTFTTATGGGAYLVSPDAEPVVIGQQSDSAARPVDRPIMAITTGGVVRVATPTAEPFLDVYYGTGVAQSTDGPLPTATTKPRHALVSPQVVPYGPRAESRSAEEPLPTVMTRDRLGVAVPIAAVITPGFGEARGQSPRIHDLDEALPAIAASGHLHLATATLEAIRAATDAVDPRRLVLIDGVLHVLDILFRMLFNEELAAAMGFPPGYRFHGTKTDITRQIGNAVCVGVARALVLAMFGGLHAERRAS